MLLRAYYDAYIRHRLIYEEGLEADAVALLAEGFTRGPETVAAEARAVLARADTARIQPEWRERIGQLCEVLFQYIGAQTSVERYHAMGAERGAILDFVDLPLNDRWWIEDKLASTLREFSGTEAAWVLNIMAEWESPPEGSFYDDVGNVAKSPHVRRPDSLYADPLLLHTPFPFFMWWEDGRSRARHAWQSDVHWPTITYNDLDPEAQYTIRLTGRGRLLMRLDGELVDLGTARMGEFQVWEVPREATADGSLVVTWDDPDEGNIHWREWSRLNEIWLLKNVVDL